MTSTSLTARDWWVAAARAADEKKGERTVILEVGPVLGICDAFVITSAPNDRLVAAIAEEVEKAVKQAGGPAPLRIEGLTQREWVLLDYGDFAVHVFLSEERDFYDLERLWRDAPKVDWAAA